MEINVTHLKDLDLSDFSDSIANSGCQNIGRVTWENACEYNDPLVAPEDQDELRTWILDFGAWDIDEVGSMTDLETNALLLQFVSGYMQERDRAENPKSWDENYGGSLYAGDDGSLYFYV